MTALATVEETTAALQGEVAELRRAVVALREELDRRDVEQMELEGAMEFTLDSERTLRCVLGALVQAMYGRRSEYEEMLYPVPHEAGIRQAEYILWRRPERRWSQFGSKQELLDLARKLGARGVAGRDSRQWIIRKLWSHRSAHGAITGAVGPYS